MWLLAVFGCDLPADGVDRWHSFDMDGDGFSPDQGDCDDGARDAHPGADEACDGVDTDCDGELDNGHPTATWGPDLDADGFGDATHAIVACDPPSSYVRNGLDCDDADGTVHPGALDTAGDGVDTDCNGRDPGTGPLHAGSVSLDDDDSAITFCLAYDGVERSLTLGRHLSTTHWASCITEVGDQLAIETPVTQPERLGNLRRVGGALAIRSDSLQSLEGLDGLWELGALDVDDASRLVSLAGIGHVDELSDDLDLSAAPLLRSLTGLENIWRIGGSIKLSETGILDFSGLAGLEELGGGIYVSNQAIDSFEGLEALRGPIGVLSLDGAEVGSFRGLDALQEISGDLHLANTTVGEWAGLDGVATVAELYVDDADLPPSFVGLAPEFGALSLSDSLVESLDGLRWSAAAEGSVGIYRCGALVDLAAFRGVTELPADLSLSGLPSLADVDDLAALTTVRGDLLIEENAALTNLDGLAALRVVEGDLTVVDNPLLDDTTVGDWASTIEVGGVRMIGGNGG